MAIAIDNNSNYSASGFLNSHELTGFQCNGSNSQLLVTAFYKDVGALDNVQANGNNMSRRGVNVGGGVAGVEAFDYTISNASFTIDGLMSTFKELAYTAVALSGVDQSTPTTGTPVTDDGFGSTATASYTGTSGNMLFVMVNIQGTQTLTASGVTEIANFSPSSSIGDCFCGYVEADGTAQTIGCTLGGSTNWRLTIVEVVASGGSPPATTGQPRIKIAGTFTQKPLQYKTGGSFVEKPVKIKVSGSFVEAQ